MISSRINGTGIVFGSYAKKKDSDPDILIASQFNKESIDHLSKTHHISIRIKNYLLKIFDRAISRDILLKEILDNHIKYSRRCSIPKCRRYKNISIEYYSHFSFFSSSYVLSHQHLTPLIQIFLLLLSVEQ